MNIPLFSVPLTSKSTHWPWKKNQFWVEHINLPSRADGHDPPGWGSAGAYKINIQMRTPSAANWPWRWLSWKIWPCPSNYILSWSLGKKKPCKDAETVKHVTWWVSRWCRWCACVCVCVFFCLKHVWIRNTHNPCLTRCLLSRLPAVCLGQICATRSRLPHSQARHVNAGCPGWTSSLNLCR